MLDTSTPQGRIIAAALKLAAERPWQRIGLIDIATEAGETLASLRTAFDGKPAIIVGFVRAVDDALLASVKKPQQGEGPRDALFEVIMARFDLLQPHKAAIRSISAGAGPDLGALKALISSQHWMLAAAGVEADGPKGAVRALGLASVYAAVFRTWLSDDDAGLARTMAALDRRLRQGERNLSALEGTCDAVAGLGQRLGGLFGSARRGESRPDPASGSPTAGDGPAGSAPASGPVT